MSAALYDSAAPRLHVLLAMCYLVHRTGAELFTRDLALWLRRRGHSVTVFANTFGEMADELRYESIACITEPAMTRRPDVIIGSTHHETVRAILQFPDVPAISICHDRSHEHGYPPRLGQVRRFVAVDDNCAERLLHEHGLPDGAVRVIPNGVDLQRFMPRADLPARPRRALVFSNYAENDGLLDEIRTACANAGLRLDAFGARLGNPVREPSQLLGEYDVVFAKGRAAAEALAVGCACILLDHSFKAMGSLVTRADVEHARRWNFGRALLTKPITSAELQAQIARHDAGDAAAVRDWVRAHAGLDATCAAFEALAREVIGEQPQIAGEPARQIADLRVYMDDWVRAHHPTGEHVLIARLRDELSHMQQYVNSREEELLDRLQRAEQSQRELSEQIHRIEAARAAEALHSAGQLRDGERYALMLHARVQSLLDSRSWRITAPLRKIYAVVAQKPAVPADNAPTRIVNVQKNGERMMAECGFLGVPTATFEQAGREQLVALLQEGLLPESRVVEFGCGCLRVAWWLIRFLERGNYHGIEPARSRVDYGLRYLFSPAEHADKRPRFDYNAAFDTSVFNTRFNYFIARSIWTHASKPQLAASLDSFVRDAADSATFLASYFPARNAAEDYQGTAWVGTSHESDVPGVIRHSLAWITEQCDQRDLTIEQIDGIDCDGQSWLRVRKRAR